MWEHFTLLLEWLGQEAWGSYKRSSRCQREGQERLLRRKRALKASRSLQASDAGETGREHGCGCFSGGVSQSCLASTEAASTRVQTTYPHLWTAGLGFCASKALCSKKAGAHAIPTVQMGLSFNLRKVCNFMVRIFFK